MVKKLGFKLAFTFEETSYYESFQRSYQDILDIVTKLEEYID